MVFGLQIDNVPIYNSGGDFLGPMMAAYAGLSFLVILVVYAYFAFTLMKTAQRLNVDNAWLAWIPIGNLVLLANMAKMHWWPVLLILIAWIPIIGWIGGIVLMVYGLIWVWKVCEARKRPGWWSLLVLIPFIGGIWAFIMWGILAWGK